MIIFLFFHENILSKERKYPGNIFHALVNTDENSSLSNACFEI